MKKCHKDYCLPICDFCKHYNYNGVDLVSKDTQGNMYIIKRAVYAGAGYCGLDASQRHPENGCEKFECEQSSLIGKIKFWLWLIFNKHKLNKGCTFK